MKILIAIPCMDMLDTRFVRCLTQLEPVGRTRIDFLAGSLVYDSREKLASEAVVEGTDYVLWLDSDMVFPPNLLRDMLHILEENHLDFLSGIYCRRKQPYAPVLYKKLRPGLNDENEIEGYDDFPEDGLFEIEGCGFGAVLMKTKVLSDSFDEFKTCFVPIPGFGEDVSFCLRARKLGYKLMADGRIQLGHVMTSVSTVKGFKEWRKLNGTIDRNSGSEGETPNS